MEKCVLAWPAFGGADSAATFTRSAMSQRNEGRTEVRSGVNRMQGGCPGAEVGLYLLSADACELKAQESKIGRF
jgi:Fe-S cluster assembly iron-binding protein IscA